MELISQSFRLNFREFCVGLYLRHINDVFQMAGLQPGKVTAEHISGERRTRAAEYLASIDWTNIQDVQKFLKVLELILSQTFIPDENKATLRQLCTQEGLVMDGFAVRLGHTGTSGRIKNLIFAADGPKPEIVLVDSTTNEIRLVENEQYCLVYDRAILQHGLHWQELVGWWQERQSLPSREAAEIALHARLLKSLASSEPEARLFNEYLMQFRHVLGEKLPALIPQVYLHYDPYTLRQLGGVKRLPRQRMDFLMLLPNDHRIVLEIDGKQHYALDNGQASPQRYAAMVTEDRRLKLTGYEVYHFGGYEFLHAEKVPEIIHSFFSALFERYAIAP
jgi:very-short-patch-repair endonuclease